MCLIDITHSNKNVFLLICTVVALCLCASSPGLAEPYTFYAGIVPPFTELNDDGSITGVSVDVVGSLMRTLGQEVDPRGIRHISWARAVFTVETTPGTALFGVARTSRREDKFKWVGPIAELNLGLVARKSEGVVVRGPEDLLRYRLGVVRDSGAAHILEEEYGVPCSAMEMVKNDATQFRMLNAGRVDVVTQADTAAPSQLHKLGLNPADFEMVYVLKRLELYLAFNPAIDDATVARLQAALDDLRHKNRIGISRYDAILVRHLNGAPLVMHAP